MRKDNTLRNEEPMEMIKVCGPTEADMIAEMLRNNGIESTLQGEVAAAILPATSDTDEVRIWVKSQDAEAAKELVDAFFTPVTRDELGEGKEELGTDDPDDKGGFTV